jgi:hypothetical protein
LVAALGILIRAWPLLGRSALRFRRTAAWIFELLLIFRLPVALLLWRWRTPLWSVSVFHVNASSGV